MHVSAFVHIASLKLISLSFIDIRNLI